MAFLPELLLVRLGQLCGPLFGFLSFGRALRARTRLVLLSRSIEVVKFVCLAAPWNVLTGFWAEREHEPFPDYLMGLHSPLISHLLLQLVYGLSVTAAY